MNLQKCIAIFKLTKRCFFRTWNRLTLLTRSLILLVIKSLVGSFVLGKLTPVATAYYAMSLGFRVPIEGVQYVSAAIATLTFLGFLLTGVCLAYFVVTLRQANFIVKFSALIVEELPWLPFALTVPLEGVLSRKQTFIVLASSVLLASAIILSIYYHTTPDPNLYLAVPLVLLGITIGMISLAILSNLTSFCQFQIWLSAGVIVATAACLFNVSLYGSFLRVIRYGGGIEYEVVVAKGSIPTSVKGYLLIQNDQMVVMMSEDKARIIEIPARLIESRGTTISPLWQLPASDIGGQTRYLKFP